MRFGWIVDPNRGGVFVGRLVQLLSQVWEEAVFLYRCQPDLCILHTFEMDHLQMRVFWHGKQLRIFSLAPPVCFEQPVKEQFTGPEFELRP